MDDTNSNSRNSIMCCIKCCYNHNGLANNNLHFHKIVIAKVPNWLASHRSVLKYDSERRQIIYICSVHFKDKDYFKTYMVKNGGLAVVKKLRTGAPPTLHLCEDEPEITITDEDIVRVMYNPKGKRDVPQKPIHSNYVGEDERMPEGELNSKGKMDAAVLIREVEKRRDIWCKSTKDQKQKAWEDLVKFFFLPKSTAEEQMIKNELRNQWIDLAKLHKAYISQLMHRSKDDVNHPKPSFVYAEQMKFLLEELSLDKKIILNISENFERTFDPDGGIRVVFKDKSKARTKINGKHLKDHNFSCSEHDRSNGEQLQISSEQDRSNGEPVQISSEQNRSNGEQEQVSSEHNRSNGEQEKVKSVGLIESMHVEESNPDRFFFVSLVPSMKSLPDHLKLAAKADIKYIIDKYTGEYSRALDSRFNDLLKESR